MDTILLGAAPFMFALGALASLVSGPRTANVIGPAFAVAGSALAAVVALHAPMAVALAWQVPLGALLLASDPLSAWFLVPTSVLGALAAVYGHGHFGALGTRRVAVGWFAYNLLLGGMTTVLLARNGPLFLVGWEVMSLAAWALVSFEHERPDTARAGWVYLIATHVGTAALIVLFLVLHSADFTAALNPPTTVVLLLALLGFGAKAGLLPLHIWLPGAHAAAPSHVSAVMSGVLVKMGIYGILRIALVTSPTPSWFGLLLVVLGLSGGVLGIALATTQRDLKRVLAYSTIENVGLITAAIGLGLWGAANGRPVVAAFGLGGALLHVWNHAAMKGLLFLGAGSILHGTGSKDMERLGGLMRQMPWTGAMVTMGAIAIAGLPPLNGFVGEWILAMGLVEAGRGATGATAATWFLSVGVVGLIGALAAACFLRLVGIVFLGVPRRVYPAHESRATMLTPMGLLAMLCVFGGIGAHLAIAGSSGVLTQFGAGPAPDVQALGIAHVALAVTVLVVSIVLAALLRARPKARPVETWACGYAAPTERMEYSAAGFAWLVELHLVPSWLRPRQRMGDVSGPFPRAEHLVVDYREPVLEVVFAPFFRSWARRFSRLRRYQQGKTWFYVGYIGAVVVLALLWSTLRGVS